MGEINWTQVVVAAIGIISAWVAGRATRAGKAKENALAAVAQERADKDASFKHMESSRDAAIEDAQRERENAQRFRIERDASDAHNAVLIQTLAAHSITVPDRPKV